MNEKAATNIPFYWVTVELVFIFFFTCIRDRPRDIKITIKNLFSCPQLSLRRRYKYVIEVFVTITSLLFFKWQGSPALRRNPREINSHVDISPLPPQKRRGDARKNRAINFSPRDAFRALKHTPAESDNLPRSYEVRVITDQGY